MSQVSQDRFSVHAQPLTLALARWQDGPELFVSVQGEGPSVGRTSIFLRLSLCNLHCVWCDTDYTWNWKGTAFAHRNDRQTGYQKFDREQEIIHLTVPEVAERLRLFGVRRLVVTGGEPLLQQEPLWHLFELIYDPSQKWFIEVETNATIVPEPQLDSWVGQYNVSPKLANSQNPDHLRLRTDVLRWFADCPKAFFKFVVEEPGDFDEIEQLLRPYAIPEDRVWIMPQGTTSAELDQRLSWIAEQCIRRGYAISDRLHVRLWGSRRGV